MHKSILQASAALLLAAAALNPAAVTSNADDVVVRVQKNGGGLDVYAELEVAAPPEPTWEVLVDYDRMAEILSSVDTSRIVNRNGNQMEVAQTSHLGVGPLRVSLHNRRRVELIPRREIRSHLIEGDVTASDFTTRLVQEGSLMRVTWHGRIVPGPLASLAVTREAVEAELRQICREMRAEILRRTARPASPPCRLAEACR